MTAARGSAAQRPAKPEKTAGKHRIVVPFDDNRLLAHLLGEYDSHLALIESRLGIEAHANGNLVTLTGAQPACEIGRTILNQIYDRVRKYAAFYDIDRPLSAEVEIIETDLASDSTLEELISQAPIPALDDFFALGTVH